MGVLLLDSLRLRKNTLMYLCLLLLLRMWVSSHNVWGGGGGGGGGGQDSKKMWLKIVQLYSGIYVKYMYILGLYC